MDTIGETAARMLADRGLTMEEALMAQVSQERAEVESGVRATSHAVPTISTLVDSSLIRNGFFPRHVKKMGVLSHSDPDQWSRATKACMSLLTKGALIMLLGPRGTGKTQMATYMAGRVVWDECRKTPTANPARYTTAVDLFIAIRETYGEDAKTSERAAIEKFSKPKLLVIDEIQERGKSPWEDKVLNTIIDRRYGHQLTTVIVGNLTREAAQHHLGPSIWSRSSECGALVWADWKSFRE